MTMQATGLSAPVRTRNHAADNRLRAILLAAGAASLLAPAAGAQQGPIPDPPARETAGPMEELIVTARRREESLQDVPGSVSALSDSRISDLQADDIGGIQFAVPNLYLEQGDASNAVIYLRGIGQNDSLAFADAGVGVYVDDVFIARSQAALLDLFDVERVEVLRGPQGTLYGRNTSGGAVKFVSTTPSATPEASLELGVGNFALGLVKARVSGPLAGESLRGKLAVTATRRDGYATNLFDGEDDGDMKSFAGRTGLLWLPADDWEVQLTLEGKLDRPDTSRSPVRATPVSGFTNPPNPASLTTFPVNPNAYDIDANANGASDLSVFGATLRIEKTFGAGWSAEQIASYRSLDFFLILDTDGTSLPILDILVDQDQEQFSYELRGTYDDGGAISFVGGVYFFLDNDLTFSGVDNQAVSVFGFPVTAFGLAGSSLADTDQQTRSYAVFADGNWEVVPGLTLGAGVRYTYENKRSGRRFENFLDLGVSIVEDTPPFLQGVGLPGVVLSGEQSFDSVTPRGSVSYQVTGDLLAYASVARGFKSGGFDGRGNTQFGFQAFDPEKVTTYEAGLKSSWAEGRLTANATYFFNRYRDLQVTSFGADPVSGTFVSLFTNAAAADIQGFELELAAVPMDGLSLNAAVGFLDAEYDEFDILVGGVPTDVSDRELVNAPEWQASLGATYTAPVAGRVLGTMHVDAAYRGRTANEITDSDLLAQNEYFLLNAFVSVATEDGAWELRAGARNLTDEEIRVQGFNLSEFPGYQLSFFSNPRIYDVRLVHRF